MVLELHGHATSCRHLLRLTYGGFRVEEPLGMWVCMLKARISSAKFAAFYEIILLVPAVITPFSRGEGGVNHDVLVAFPKAAC